MTKYVKASEEHIDELDMEITIGYPMRRSDVEKELRANGLTWEDYEGDERLAFIEMAQSKFGQGYGCNVVILDD